MKKHLFLSLISLSLILCLTACGNSKKNAAEGKSSITAETGPEQLITETVDRQIIDWADEETIAIMRAYQSVLQDETEFFVAYDDNKTSTSIFSQMLHMREPLNLGSFAVIDLDGDNHMEFIISLVSARIPDIDIFLIFHCEDKKVYEYTLAYRQFEGLKIDGTFNVSGGHTNHGIGTLSFQKGSSGIVSLITDDFTYITDESTDDESESGLSVSYYVNHALSTKAEFDKALSTQENKPDAVWHAFSEKNIEDFFQNAADETESESFVTEIEHPVTETEHPVTETIDRQVIDRTDSKVQEALAAYKAVLLDNAELFYASKTSFNQILDDWYGTEYSPEQFAIIDLDRDGLPEVIVPYPRLSYLNGYFIFHYAEKENLVYVYDPSNRQFGEPKIDGTFHASGGTSGSSTKQITSFAHVTYSDKEITTFYSSIRPDGDDLFLINSKSVTEEEFDAAWAEQDNKQGVTWYDFTEENIDTYFSIK